MDERSRARHTRTEVRVVSAYSVADKALQLNGSFISAIRKNPGGRVLADVESLAG
jgi:hypothetical protein